MKINLISLKFQINLIRFFRYFTTANNSIIGLAWFFSTGLTDLESLNLLEVNLTIICNLEMETFTVSALFHGILIGRACFHVIISTYIMLTKFYLSWFLSMQRGIWCHVRSGSWQLVLCKYIRRPTNPLKMKASRVY